MNFIQFAEDEKIIYSARRHWLAFMLEIIFIIIGAILPYLLYMFKGYFAHYTFLSFYSNHIIFLLTYVLWAEFLLILFFVALSDHYLDAWIITDSRIIDIEQKGTFSRQVISLRYESILEMTVPKKNILETIFGFGTLNIKNSNGEKELVLSDIHHPEKFRQIILEEQRKSLERLAGTMRARESLQEKENPPTEGGIGQNLQQN